MTDRASSTARTRPKPWLVALSLGGVAFTAIQLIVGTQAGLFPVPGGDELIWDRVGDAIWSGEPIYYLAPVPTDSFWYAPPVAVLFGALSWMPIVLQHLLFTVLKILSLRVIAGSWIGAGVACWFPLVAFELGGGNFNLLIAAAIVLAIHRHPEGAVVGALAKLGPGLAIDPRDWRRVAIVGAALAAITLPWLRLWPEWATHLIANIGFPLGPQIPISFPVRLAAALAIILVFRTTWARALAATIAIPAFYWGSLVVLIAPVAILIRERLDAGRRGPASTPAGAVPATTAPEPAA
jgi:hypothetical protein